MWSGFISFINHFQNDISQRILLLWNKYGILIHSLNTEYYLFQIFLYHSEVTTRTIKIWGDDGIHNWSVGIRYRNDTCESCNSLLHEWTCNFFFFYYNSFWKNQKIKGVVFVLLVFAGFSFRRTMDCHWCFKSDQGAVKVY